MVMETPKKLKNAIERTLSKMNAVTAGEFFICGETLVNVRFVSL